MQDALLKTIKTKGAKRTFLNTISPPVCADLSQNLARMKFEKKYRTGVLKKTGPITWKKGRSTNDLKKIGIN